MSQEIPTWAADGLAVYRSVTPVVTMITTVAVYFLCGIFSPAGQTFAATT